MQTYLVITRGDSPKTARPILASSDPAVVREAMQAIVGRVEGVTGDGQLARRRGVSLRPRARHQ